jgi:hypothetical protein
MRTACSLRRSLGAIGIGAALLVGLLAAPQAAAQDIDLRDLYRNGITFEEFLEKANRRREAWHDHYEQGAPTHQALMAARELGAQVKFLVVAEDWCGDSVNTVPYLARLVEQVDGWEMRVINSRRGADLMAANPTPDGRSATPTIVVLDNDNEQLGAFVERPTVLQEWFLRTQDEIPREELFEQKYTWYAEDAGEETVRELTELIRQATRRE